MTQAAVGELDERVPGRRWTVRLDAAGRGSTAVRVSCSRPACSEQRFPSAAAGRAAAVAHIKAHLRAAPAPRATAYCACRLADCHTHLPDTGRPRTAPWRCGGPVVLAVVTDREGRWWQVMECCSRCAAATPGAKTAATSVPTAPDHPSSTPAATPAASAATSVATGVDTAAGAGVPQFSDHQVAGSVPLPRNTPARRRPPPAKISQRIIPDDLRPTVLRDELIELGNLFRAYQQRDQPDLELLADLQERKARAFTTWADITGEGTLRWEARRAERAAATARLQHQQRISGITGGDGPVVNRLLTVPGQWEHARSVLAHVANHTPLPGADARLLVLMLTLRTAHTGTGNLVGQDLTALGLTDPQDLVEKLTDCGWLSLPCTAGDLLASRPENATPITVPSLASGEDGAGPFTFGKKMRPKLSGWAQRVVSDKKLRKTKATSATRLLALTLATQSSASGRLGTGGHGVFLTTLAAMVPAGAGELERLVDQLTAADWLTNAALTDIHLTGQLTERVLPLTCPCPPSSAASP
ncbi:hypothetical protein [Streptomyces sp. NPDC057939]|uniref:hypothetical protein n=1 Tax=Streptomyces sp. NPDC057939 TaxID=3346284 RepID=UPI0036F08D1C